MILLGLAIAYSGFRAEYDREFRRCENVLARAEAGQNEKMKVYFNDAINKDSREMDAILVCYIQQAQESIDAHFYQANLISVRDALLAAKERGVQVRFITDDHYYEDYRYYSIFYEPLIVAGIPLIHDQMVSHTNGQSHNKFAVIDGRYVWTGSMNITNNGAALNANNALWIDSPELAADYLLEFNEMWGGTGIEVNETEVKFGNLKSANTHNRHLIPALGQVDLCFDPSDGCSSKTQEALETAQYSIYFATFSFTDDTIGNLIVDKIQQEGVRIEGIFHQADCRYGEYPKLKEVSPDSIYLRTELTTVPRLIHHKFFIIDPGTDSDPIVITGSRNISSSSETKNDENMLIIHNADLALRYLEMFRVLTSGRQEKLTDACL